MIMRKYIIESPVADKTAADFGRGLGWDKIRQTFNFGDHARELFDSDFKTFRRKIIQTDKDSRQIAETLKPALMQAEISFKQKDYLTSADKLGNYFDILEAINNKLKELFDSFTVKEFSLLIDHLPVETQRKLLERRNKKRNKRAAQDVLVKIAFMDWLKKLRSTHRRAMDALEKNFGATSLRGLRDGLAIALKRCNMLQEQVLQIFKDMSGALARGKFDNYRISITELAEITDKHIGDYDEFFKRSVEPYHAEIQKRLDAEEAKPSSPYSGYGGSGGPGGYGTPFNGPPQAGINPSPGGAPVVPLASKPKPTQLQMPSTEVVDLTTSDAAPTVTQPNSPMTINPPQQVAPVTAPTISEFPQAVKPENRRKPKQKKSTVPGTMPGLEEAKASDHSEFLTKLAAIEEPVDMIKEILAYSAVIEDRDIDTSLKLLAVAEGILDS